MSKVSAMDNASSEPPHAATCLFWRNRAPKATRQINVSTADTDSAMGQRPALGKTVNTS